MVPETYADVMAEPPAVGRVRVSDNVSTYLRELIMSGQLRGGEPIRVQHLAKRLDVSITPIRESLLELWAEGLVDRAPRRGYRVAPLSESDIADVFAANSLLAGELAARAALRISDDALAELTDLQKQLRAAAKRSEYAEMDELNQRFHRTINHAAASPKLSWFIRRTSHYALRWTWPTVRSWPRSLIQDHRPLVQALRAHDPDAARASMQRHITHSGELLIDHLAASHFWDRD